MNAIISDTLDELVQTKGDLFPSATNLFAVVDEAQVGAEGLTDYFISSDHRATPFFVKL